MRHDVLMDVSVSHVSSGNWQQELLCNVYYWMKNIRIEPDARLDFSTIYLLYYQSICLAVNDGKSAEWLPPLCALPVCCHAVR